MNKIIISPLSFPIDGRYTHNLQVVTSVDGGRTFYYCGNGKYSTAEDIEKTAAELMEKFNTNIIERRAQGV